MRDLGKMQRDPPAGVNAAPLAENMMVWQAVIFGPDDTVWEGGTFNLIIEFTEDYPNKPPKVRFVSKVYHPNVYVDGNICLDLLQSQWSPIYDVGSILTAIQSLLSDPNPASPANAEAASLFQTNRAEYERKVQECVEASWVADPGAAVAAAEAELADEAAKAAAATAAAAPTAGTTAAGGGTTAVDVASPPAAAAAAAAAAPTPT